MFRAMFLLFRLNTLLKIRSSYSPWISLKLEDFIRTKIVIFRSFLFVLKFAKEKRTIPINGVKINENLEIFGVKNTVADL